MIQRTKKKSTWRSQHPEPIPGQQYGDWTIIEDYRETNKSMKDKLLVQCSCGTYREVILANMIYGKSTSCGHNQYNIDPAEFATRKNQYRNRIGEVIDGYTLRAYDRTDNTRTFTITCPNGHDHTFTRNMGPTYFIRQREFACWCLTKDPIHRMRERKGMTLEDVGEIYGLSRERIRQYEVDLRNKKPLTKKRNGKTEVEMYLYDYRFERLANAYNLTEKEQELWIDEILYNRFYEYDEPKRIEYLHQHLESDTTKNSPE